MSRTKQRGFSVVEVMVAMTLSLVLLSGALFVVYSSKVTYSESERVARLQENGRQAVELMLRDMRAGGFRGCTQGVPFTNALNEATGLMWNFENLVQGFESTAPGTWSPALDSIITSPADDSDVVAIRTVRADMPVLLTSDAMASPTSSISITRDPTEDLITPRTVLISDCNAAAVFSVSTYTPSGTTAILEHATGDPEGPSPGNATEDIGFAFLAGAQIVPIDTVVYYIRQSDTVRPVRNPALWRIVGPGEPEELVEGVERMQILYGEDTDGDRLVDEYVAANAVGNWSRIISVSFALLIRSVEPNAREKDTRTYSLLGTDVGPFNDFFERTLYTTTVALRNNTG